MLRNWSPYPRYRLYTTPASYLPRFHSKNDAIQNFEDEVCRRFQIPAAVAVPMARVGIYLALLETIRPGQTVEFPVVYFVDPRYAADKDAVAAGPITLSYTFFPAVTGPKVASNAATSAPN